MRSSIIALVAVLTAVCAPLHAEESASAASDNDLAMQLANPIASLISLPIQNNFDWGGGPAGGGVQCLVTTDTHTTFSLNTESSYDWTNDQWNVPVNLGVAQLLKVGGSPVQFQLGGRYYAETPANGPDWGLRFTVTLLWSR